MAAYPQNKQTKTVDMVRVFECIAQIRNLRNSKGLSPKEAFAIGIKTTQQQAYSPYFFLIKKLFSFMQKKGITSILRIECVERW